MKKLVAVVLGLFVLTGALFAEKNYEESDYSYLNIPLLKIYEHKSAYVVIYQAHGVTTRECYIPKSWINQGSKERCGKIRSLPKGLQAYMTLIFKNGEFTSIYLSVPSNHDDPVWGTLMGDDSQLPNKIDPSVIASYL